MATAQKRPSAAALKAIEDDLLARIAAREHFASWLEYRGAQFKPAKHHDLIIRNLEAVERGDIKRLLLVLPPGSAKSTYSSVEFVPWYLGRNPGKSILAASHSYDLAERFGKKARNIVASRDFTNVFEASLAQDTSAAGQWATSLRAEYMAAGVGTGIAGIRADLGLIDDPVKSREAAESERTREATWDWYKFDFTPRLKPDARQILIQTKWHADDLAGRILARDGDLWTVIRIPMEADEPNDPLGRQIGERLWPEWFTDEMVLQAKKDARLWNALYQGNPIPDEGNFFKRDWFIEYDDADLPSTLQYYGTSDYAVVEGKGDYTEHAVWGLDFDGDVWLADWWSGQTGPEVWIESQCDLILKHRPMVWFGEAGPIRRSTEPFLRKRMETRRAYCHLEWLASINDKTTRARAFQALASMGKVKIPKNKPWMARVLAQWLQFPAGRHDDCVDVASLLGRGLEFVSSAPRATSKQRRYEPSANAWMG